MAPAGTAGAPTRRRRRGLERREVPALIGWAALAAAVIEWFPWLGPLAYPFRLLLTLVHELSHGLAALLTGGEFLRLVTFADGSGLAYTAGGWRLVVIPAGYLGAAAFGAALILVGASPRAARWTLGVVGAAIALLALRYGAPSLLTDQALGGLLATVTGCGLGAFFVLLAIYAGPRWVVFVIHLVAIETVLAALSDLWTLLGVYGDTRTDARSMAEVTFVPALVWALVWALAAAAIVLLAIRRAWFSSARASRPAIDAARR